MRRLFRSVLTLLLLAAPVVAAGPPPGPVAATVETTLATDGGDIRQFAFDGDPDTCFVSARDAGSGDHFTLLFDRPVAVTALEATTGRPQGGDRLDTGTLEVSADGKTFEELTKFADGVARARPAGQQVQAVRLRPGADLKHPLAIREIVIKSEPAVAVFQYPIEIKVDAAAAPDLKEWGERAARVCERQYPMICETLRSDGFKPRRMLRLRLTGYDGVARAGGASIEASARYFKRHPDDVGAMVHETVHCVQAYRGGNNPSWLVEGIADYIRFFKYEPGKLGPVDAKRAHYDGSYRVTAAFLAFVSDRYDKDLVRKLNAALRAGTYKDDVFKDWTGKTLKALDEEWRASLRG
jgi:hypothetical protein